MSPSPPIPRLLRPMVPVLAGMTAGYISYHRNRLWAGTATIDERIQMRLRGFFPHAALAETRMVKAVMPEPGFYPLVKLLGIRGLLEVSSIGAITLLDVVAYREELELSTLFHELVHAVQYRVLGLKRFSRLYVKGFLAGGEYAGIPLERQAYELTARFDENAGRIFSVEQEVIQRHQAGLL